MIGQPIAVEDTTHTRDHVENEKARILASDNWIESSQQSCDGLNFAEQVTEHVDQVDRCLVDKKPRHFPEVWLAIAVCIRALPITRAEPECRLKNPAEPTVLQDLFDHLVPGLEAKIFVNYQSYSGCFGNTGGFSCFAQRRTKWLLEAR